jgi:hypothetical protein
MRTAMTEAPVDLDKRRGMAAQKATESRRQHLIDFRSDQQALRQRQEELEAMLLADPAETWPEAAAKAEYIIRLFAATHEGQDPRRQQLVTNVLEDFSRLGDQEMETP